MTLEKVQTWQPKYRRETSIHCIIKLTFKDYFCSKNLQVFEGSKKGLKKDLEEQRQVNRTNNKKFRLCATKFTLRNFCGTLCNLLFKKQKG